LLERRETLGGAWQDRWDAFCLNTLHNRRQLARPERGARPGGYQTPKIPALSAQLPSHIPQLHTDSYRNPGQLPDGAVHIVGTGQSGGQIAEELLAVGRNPFGGVPCPEAPRRYCGQDLLYWMMQLAQFVPD
jgi:putative flavoprotein involved in K+ transport